MSFFCFGVFHDFLWLFISSTVVKKVKKSNSRSDHFQMKTETAKEVLKAVATHPDVRGSFVQAR